MKRVNCLYRVSTKRQVDKSDENDIPMQYTACHEFAERNGWIIKNEFYEKGVSGFKVSANKRDSIQDLKKAAEKNEFDILLVFMFDRIGRIDDETPFVVEWFVKHGIEVWSVTEGEQRFESHVDKLTNYIRFWQANGESRKSSIRIKESMNQLTEKGVYTGGVTPFGYKTVPSGRFNKSGKELIDIVIDTSESPIVRMIYEKTIREGYGSHRLAEMLNGMGIKTHNGSGFQCNTINRILSNRMYCGYYISSNIESPHLPHLQIIDEETFELVQNIRARRNVKNEQKTQIALTTKGKTLLSGNIFCGDCGSRMNASSYIYKGKEGEVRKQRYMCCNRHRRIKTLDECSGQANYIAEKVDSAVNTIISEYLSRIQTTAKSVALEKRYHTEIAETKDQMRMAEQERRRLDERLSQLADEVGKSLTGESLYTPDVLSMSIEKTKKELQGVEDSIVKFNFMLNNSQGAMSKLDFYYDQFRSWAEEFHNASLEQRKMIVCQLIKEVRMSKGYQIDIELDMSYAQFLAVE